MFDAKISLTLADAAGAPQDASEVVLSDVSGAYGLIPVGESNVTVPAGTPLTRLDVGRYELNVGLSASKIYRYAVKIRLGSQAFYLRGYLCPAAQQAELAFSFSDSTSDPESEEPPSSQMARLVREDSIRRFVFGQANSHRLRIRVVAAAGITDYLLGHQDRVIEAAGTKIRQFAMIPSPRDLSIYPIDEADENQTPAYYRRNYIDVILPNADVADQVWTEVKLEIDNLIAARKRLEILEG